MRVLFLSHLFLPNHPAGTEIHTAELALGLRELGVDAQVFCTEKDIARVDGSLHRREWEGVPVHELVNNLFYENFRQTWDWPKAAQAFGRVLDELQPDVVHVMHLIYLSVGCVEEAHRRGIPVIFTLHDFWLTCPRFGQLRHVDGSICHKVEFDRCGTCISHTKYAQTAMQRRVARAVASIKTVSGLDLSDTVKRVGLRVSKSWQGDARPAPEPTPSGGPEQEMAREVGIRDSELKRRLLPCVTLFISPSEFLAKRFVDWGVPTANIEVVRNGIQLAPYAELERPPRDPNAKLRVAFLGTPAPHKAPHLLLEAWGRLPEELRARGELTLFGPKHHDPEYVIHLVVRARELGAHLPGPVERRDVPKTLMGIDLLVVPSVWYENAPLSLLEARAARTPVLASDLGGMAEGVIDGHTGWLFPVGDVDALAKRLAEVLAHPELLDGLDFFADPVTDSSDLAGEMIERYTEVCGGNA